jgi:hypothetical protein
MKPMIQKDKDFDKLVHMVTKELYGRLDGVKRKVVQSISHTAMEGVQMKAPREDPDLENYTNDFELVQLDSGKDISYGFVYKGGPISSSAEQDTDTTVLEVMPIKKKVGRWSLIFSIMGEYGPFTLNTWPLKIPKDRAYISFRNVSKAEVKNIEERNQREANDIRLALSKTGMRVSLHDFGTVTNSLDIKKDMAFTVMRKELGIATRATPHWRPGIRTAKSGNSVNRAINDMEVQKSMSDMNYQGWKGLGMMSETVSNSDIKEIEEFQDKIIKGV